jgi:peptide deformylase
MIQLNLTDEEEQHLREAVRRRLSELDHEIEHTDSIAFKDMLKRRRETMQKIIEKLPDLAASAA